MRSWRYFISGIKLIDEFEKAPPSTRLSGSLDTESQLLRDFVILIPSLPPLGYRWTALSSRDKHFVYFVVCWHYRSKFERSLSAEVHRQKLKIHFYSFNFFKIFYFIIYLCISLYIHLQINCNILKPSWCLNSIPRPVFFINFSRRIQIS